MRHVALTTVAFVAAVAIVACEQQVADQNPTAPEVDLSFAKQLGGQCDAARLRAIGDEQKAQWANPYLAQATALFDLVSANCSNTAGKSYMLDYIQWTIDNRTNRKSGTTNGQLISHWNTVFPYVGYTGADQPLNVPDSVFTVGAAKVIDGGQTGELTAPNAALTFYAQSTGGDLRDHLFVIYPIPANCLTGSNLQQFGPCFRFDAYPHQTAVWNPKAKMGICEIHDPLDQIQNHISSPALAHLDPIAKVTDSVGSHYPAYCLDDVASIPRGSWHNGFGAAVTRLAWMAKRAVTPQSAYAGHGGLGGLGGGFSPIGAVDLEVFHADFENNAVGAAPSAPETGSWQIVTLTPPGTITVQNSLGQQNSKLVVLQQSGGNCKNCGGLYLRGNFESAGSQATAGTYDAEFDALQSQSNMKEAVFALRDNNDVNIATITFAVRNNTNLILYNDKKGSPQQLLGNWVQNVPVHFRVRVSLGGINTGDAQSTEVWVNEVSKFAGVPFLANAANFSRIAADFRGIDSGTMGWDNIIVTRLSDEN
jgi:hypothetical protein